MSPPATILPLPLPVPLLVALTLPCTGAAAQTQFAAAPGRPQSLLDVGAGNLPGTLPGIATADLDGDGDAEILTNGLRELRRHTRAPDGSWTAAVVAVAAELHNGAADLWRLDADGDGRPDVAWSAREVGSGTGFHLFVNGAQGLLEVATPVSSIATQGVTAGDYDGDGDLDLIAGHLAAAAVPQALHVLRNSNGVFAVDAAAMPPATPADVWPLAGDYDGDGDMDVVGLTRGGPVVYFVNTAAVFADGSALVPAGAPVDARHGVAGDLDGDGSDDVVVATAGGDLDVLWGGAGGFVHQPGLIGSVFGAERVRAGDLDGDGDLDLVAAAAQMALVLDNAGGRTFAARAPHVEPVAVVAERVADVDGDGNADLLLGTGSPRRRVRCLYGPDLVEDAAATRGLPPDGAWALLPAAGDLDGDGRTDLLAVDRGALEVHFGAGAGRFRRAATGVTSVATNLPARAWLPDLDGDGDPDPVVLDVARLIVTDNSGGNVTVRATTFLGSSANLYSFAMGDIDGDGDQDFVNAQLTHLDVFENVAGGTLSRTMRPWALSAAARVVTELVDLDGDGDLDLVCSGRDAAGTPAVLANDGAGNFAPGAVRVPLPQLVGAMAAGDVDLDGDVDLVVADVSTQGLLLFANDGTGVLADRTAGRLPPLTVQSTGPVVLRDFDEDGDIDILCSRQDGSLALLLGGGGVWIAAGGRVAAGLAVAGSSRAAAADVDGDGDLDAVLWSRIGGTSIAYNHTRQLASAVLPRTGARLALDLYSGPRYSPPGLGIVVAGLAQAALPVPAAALLPGAAGSIDLDLASPTVVIAALPLATLGVSRAFAQLPNLSQLVGRELFFQGVVLSNGPQPSGVTDAVREVILP